MEQNKIRIKEQDLVLTVGNNVDISKWDESKYDNFVLALTNGRKYQEEAIFTALRFMCGDQYSNIRDLASENYINNPHLKEKYPTQNALINRLFFQKYYTANIDLATGTGKSWVLYGLATIMLCAGFVDQVLVLVPSITIERELKDKFEAFAMDSKLNDCLSSVPPKIISGNESIVKGCICIENRDAIYKNARNSIVDSLTGKGERTLILNDESHHIYYSEQNQWKSFIENINPKYNIGVSGTCYYKDNDYFVDVIYRYSLKQAIDDGWIKSVSYIIKENMPAKKEEQWQVIVNSHNEIKNKLSVKNILPISIIVTEKTNSCDSLAKRFKTYLKTNYNLTDDEVNERVLVVHSKPNAAADRARLKDVDSPNSKVEWIFSVSMLTEGWDVKRVFQIIPDEERAFNSKLLIAQVLGRGLRVPSNWSFSFGKPEVIVFNHEKWAFAVKKLVDEILEIERRISTKVLQESDYHFEILNCEYKKVPIASPQTKQKVGLYNLFDKGYITLPTTLPEESVEIELSNLKNESKTWKTKLTHNTISVEDMAYKMWDRFRDIPDDDNLGLAEQYQAKYPVETLEKIIKRSLKESGNTVITESLANKFIASMSTAWRQGSTYVTYSTKPDKFFEVKTKSLCCESTSASGLKNSNTLFWTDNTKSHLSDEEIEFFNEIIDTSNGYRQKKVSNKNTFKTVTSFCFSNHEPEKRFIDELIASSKIITSWVKSTSKGFYSIDFSWKKNPRHGEAIRYEKFNPDFFIKANDKIIIVEIKGDEEIPSPHPENVGKHIAAVEHVRLINQHLNEEKYKFTMLTPRSYNAFFESIKNNTILKFNSELDVEIEKNLS